MGNKNMEYSEWTDIFQKKNSLHKFFLLTDGVQHTDM